MYMKIPFHKIIPILSIVVLSNILIACKKQKNNSRVEALPYYNEASFTPHWIKTGSHTEKEFHKIPDFKLINQLGKKITQNTFENKIYVTNFFFTTCPGICPKMTNNMFTIQEAFKTNHDVLLLSHSVTPNRDSVAVLKNYAENRGVQHHKWHLVTGNRKEIYHLGKHAYFIEEDLGEKKEEEDFLHTENFVLIDKNKHIRGIYNGLNKTSVNQLIQDIYTLLLE